MNNRTIALTMLALTIPFQSAHAQDPAGKFMPLTYFNNASCKQYTTAAIPSVPSSSKTVTVLLNARNNQKSYIAVFEIRQFVTNERVRKGFYRLVELNGKVPTEFYHAVPGTTLMSARWDSDRKQYDCIKSFRVRGAGIIDVS